MKLIVGLGNPGTAYTRTRHNIGSKIVTVYGRSLARRETTFEKKWGVVVTYVPSKKSPSLVLATPRGKYFMNQSGIYVKLLCTFFHVLPQELWLVHDDKDLPLGTMRIVEGRGAAGHRGVESVIQSLHTNAFVRFRIGIASPHLSSDATDEFVIAPFAHEEQPFVKKSVAQAREALQVALAHGVEIAMNRYN